MYGSSNWGLEVLRPQWSKHVAQCLNVAPEQVREELQDIDLDGDEDPTTPACDNPPPLPHWLVVPSSTLNLDDDEAKQRVALKEYLQSMYSQ